MKFLTLVLALVAPAAAFMAPRSSASMRPLSVMSVDVEGKLKEIVAEQLGVDLSTITPDASFAADLGADSLDVVEMVMKIAHLTRVLFLIGETRAWGLSTAWVSLAPSSDVSPPSRKGRSIVRALKSKVALRASKPSLSDLCLMLFRSPNAFVT